MILILIMLLLGYFAYKQLTSGSRGTGSRFLINGNASVFSWKTILTVATIMVGISFIIPGVANVGSKCLTCA